MSTLAPTHYVWERLDIDEIGVMSTVNYKFGNPDEPWGSWTLMASWHDFNSLECPCGGQVLVRFNEVHQAHYPGQHHLMWTGQRCPADRIDELRQLVDRLDHNTRRRIHEMQLVPFPDNPQT